MCCTTSDLSFIDGKYYLTVEDNEGALTGFVRHGGQLVSDDGISWQPHAPRRVYPHDIEYNDGSSIVMDRRERPELFDARREIKGLSEPTHLVTAVWSGGEAWCTAQAISP